ncbi:O-antigen ligase family protein [Allomuricauda sp.]|uniref:O-antigen ligase family protein n=1 Tax=Flagellimonas alginolytica TaxID=3177515 RepID=UPI0025DCE857|nr:O-antigen ligase family protein [Allomuricauda sp.]
MKEGVRSRLTNAGDAYFEKRGFFINTFGEGFSSYTTNLGNDAPEIKHSKSNYKEWLLVETDYYDFIGAFGILLTLFFYSFYFYWLTLSGIHFFNKKTIYSFSLFLIFLMAMGHGYLAGHVFYSPTVMGIMAIVITLIMHQSRKGEET